MATKRAKNLAYYLEDVLGWTVFDEVTKCTTCTIPSYGDNFCPKCGTKLSKKDVKKQVYRELEEALVYAVDKDA